MAITRADICLSLQRALIGEIYPEVRMIAFRHNQADSSFTLMYILDREPTDDDYETVSVVLAEFMSDFRFDEFSEFHEKCIYTLAPMPQIPELREMDLMVYGRKEYW